MSEWWLQHPDPKRKLPKPTLDLPTMVMVASATQCCVEAITLWPEATVVTVEIPYAPPPGHTITLHYLGCRDFEGADPVADTAFTLTHVMGEGKQPGHPPLLDIPREVVARVSGCSVPIPPPGQLPLLDIPREVVTRVPVRSARIHYEVTDTRGDRLTSETLVVLAGVR
ncbi:hypothetical protein [Embleya scabrispora]|nr:hypothetical protein [Embleya scabrispora]